MGKTGGVAGQVFISYVREDSGRVDRLQRELEAVGIRVWRDTVDLWPGQDWRVMIRRAITDGALVFLACFSRNSSARPKSYQNEELLLAIEQLRLRQPSNPWLIPVRFDECDIPDTNIGPDRTLRSIQRADLFGDGIRAGYERLVTGIKQILETTTDLPFSGAASERTGRIRQVHFAGREFDDPIALAAAFQQNWAEGLGRLYQVRDVRLADELDRMLRQRHLDEALRLIEPAAGGGEPPLRYASLLAEMDPNLTPVYDAVLLTPSGLVAASAAVVSADGDDHAARVLDEVRRLDILISWRNLPGMGQCPKIQQRWAAASKGLEARAESLRRYGYHATSADLAYARAWLLLCILEPDPYRRELTSLVDSLDSQAAERQDWWRDLRRAPEPTVSSLVLALLTAPFAAARTGRQQQWEQDKRQGEAEGRREVRVHRLAARREIDHRLINAAVGLVVTVAVPYGLGRWWAGQFSRAGAPPPDPRAVSGWAHFVPEVLVGTLVIAGLLGLALLRPPWHGRRARILAGLALVAVSLAAPDAGNQALAAFYRAGQARYVIGPMPIADLNGQCGWYWTSDHPVGTGYMRWALTDSDTVGCHALAAYQGWRELWQVQVKRDNWWERLHVFSNANIAVAEELIAGKPNVLEAFAASTGRRLWVFSCQDGDPRYLSVITYSARTITVACARGQVKVNPITGAAIS